MNNRTSIDDKVQMSKMRKKWVLFRWQNSEQNENESSDDKVQMSEMKKKTENESSSDDSDQMNNRTSIDDKVQISKKKKKKKMSPLPMTVATWMSEQNANESSFDDSG